MFEKIAESILKGFVAPVPAGTPNEVRIEIPRSHPKAAALLKLARALATREQLASGVVVQKLYRPGADEEFLDALREFGIDVDAIKASLEQPHPQIDFDSIARKAAGQLYFR